MADPEQFQDFEETTADGVGEEEPDDGIAIEADTISISASEKVSTGDYENANFHLSVEASVEGATLDDGVPPELVKKATDVQTDLAELVRSRGEERKDSPAPREWE